MQYFIRLADFQYYSLFPAMDFQVSRGYFKEKFYEQVDREKLQVLKEIHTWGEEPDRLYIITDIWPGLPKESQLLVLNSVTAEILKFEYKNILQNRQNLDLTKYKEIIILNCWPFLRDFPAWLYKSSPRTKYRVFLSKYAEAEIIPGIYNNDFLFRDEDLIKETQLKVLPKELDFIDSSMNFLNFKRK